MHARNRTWLLGSDPAERCRQRTMPVEGGDGSTLTLDFTTGVLDPRLTFTRLSDATLINSSGLVQWAAANRGPRTNWAFTNPAGLGWNAATTVGTGTFQWVGDGTVIASSGASGQAYTSISAATQIAQGIRYVMSVTAQSVTGSPTIQSIFDFTSATGNTYFKNGATANATTTVASGDRISVSAIADNTGMNIRMGCGAWFASRTNESVTLTQFHWHPGSVPVPYYENTTGSPRYDSARFDHDPTTRAPRGLLIEAAATNFAPYSNLQLAWAGGTNTTLTPNTTEVLSPDGTNNAAKIALTNTGYCSRFESITGLANATTYTFSYWIRGTAGNQQRVYSVTQGVDLVTQSTLTYTSTGWTRVQITFTSGAANNNVYIYVASRPTGTVNDVLYVYGCQLEAGSGASSYIPTGASQGSRAADSCVMTGTNFSSWFAGATEGVLYAEVEQPRKINSPAAEHGVVSTLYTSGTWLGIQVTATNQFPSSVIWPTGGFVSAGGIATRVPLVSKQAVRWFNGASITNFGNGTQGSTTVGTGSVTLGLLTIGANVSSGTTANLDWLNGCIRRVKFWPTALPNATIQALTT